MKKIAMLSLLSAFLLVFAGHAETLPDQHQHPSCSYCGMDRVKFAQSRMLVEYEDGSAVGTCSIHCMAVEFANAIDKMPARLLVADYNSRQLIDAQSAVWVIGGDQRGVMTARPKWAFSEQPAAEAFIAAHGGSLATFEQAMKFSYEDMYEDTTRIRKMRAMKKHKKMN